MSFSSRRTKKSAKWRGALIYLALFGAAAPAAFGAETRYVTNFSELSSAIAEYNANTGDDFEIVLRNSITLAGNLPMITGNPDLIGVDNGSLTISGNWYEINGANSYRGLFIDTEESGGVVTVSSVGFANCVATGGAGGAGASGGGGGMGAGSAIYALSGEVFLNDVTAHSGQAIGGAGGGVLQESQSYAGGGGIGGAGGSGVVGETGAADGGGIFFDGANSQPTRVAGDGGVTDEDVPESYAHYVNITTPVGGDSLAGGGGGGSTQLGGAGGFGGGGGGGAAEGGVGGFGGGGGGGASEITAGVGGFGGGDGGYVPTVTSEQFSDTQGGGTGGGGAALGGAIFVGPDATLKIAVSKDHLSSIYNNSLTAGAGGGGTAENGEAIGVGVFLLNDLTIEVAEGGEYYVSDNIGGYAGSSKAAADANGDYEDWGGVVKTGEGALYMNASGASYTGDTTVKGGKLVARQENAISQYSNLNVESGTVELEASQSVKNLNGGEGAVVDLGGQTLTVTGNNDGSYGGAIKGDGLLLKRGSGVLELSGDNSEEGTFNTEIQAGTIRVLNDAAFGTGDVYYTRTDRNDRTAALEFGDEVTLDNDIYLYRNGVPLILSGGSATLNGRVGAKESSASAVEVRMNDGATLTLGNTGVTTDESGAQIATDQGNAINEYRLVSGNLSATVDSIIGADGETREWYSSLGSSKITSLSDTVLTFTLNTSDPDAGLVFANNLAIESGWLTLDPVTLADSGDQVSSIYYQGSTSGEGGLRVNVGEGATVYASGVLGHAKTEIISGSLDVSNVAGATVDLSELTSDGAGELIAGDKEIVITVDPGDDVHYDGSITGDDEGATIRKRGAGAWTLNLSGDSNVKAIEIEEGVFSLGENHYESGVFPSNDFKVEVWSQGAFKHSTENGATLELNNFVASTPGGAIEIGAKDELVLTSENESTTIAANLFGEGWLYLENVEKDGEIAPWVISGDNSNWSGSIAAYDNNAMITLASANAATANSSLYLGAGATLNVEQSTTLGKLDFDNNATINATNGKTLTLGALSSNSLWLDDSTTTIAGGGTVEMLEGAGKTYYGATLLKDGSSLVLRGDNRAEEDYGASRRGLTLTDGSSVVMDYSSQGPDGVWTSLWGSKINVDGDGTISVFDKTKLMEDESGNYTQFNGGIEISDEIAFVGEDANNLTFGVDGATTKVALRSEIQGVGALTKTGAGTLILDGAGEFGTATIRSGVLQLGSDAAAVNDQLANAAVAIKGGALAGWTDSLGSVSLESGVLNILKTGGVTLTGTDTALSMSGGTIYVNVLDKDNYTNFTTADENAKIVLDGGAIYVDTATNNVTLDTGDSLAIVKTGAGNLSVNKSNYTIYDDIAGKRFVVDGAATADGSLNLVLTASTFSEFATTPNERGVAEYLDAWNESGAMDADTRDFLTELENAAAENHQTLNQLTGEIRLSAFNAQVQSRNFIRQTLTQNVLPPAGTGGVVLGQSALRGQVYEETDGISGWGAAYGASGKAEERKGLSGYDYGLLGGIFGVELGRKETNQLGFFFSYGNMEVKSDLGLGKVRLDDNLFGLYLRVSDEWGYTFANGTIGVSDYDLSRRIVVPNYPGLRYSSSTDGWSGSAYLERGFTFSMLASDLQPYAGLQYTHLQADGFTEGGQLQSLSIKTGDQEYNSLEGVLGVRWLKTTCIGASQLDFNAYANWTHEYLDANAEGKVGLVGGPNGTFKVVGNGVGRDWVYAGLGGDLHATDCFTIFGGADVQVNKYTTYVNGRAGMKYTW